MTMLLTRDVKIVAIYPFQAVRFLVRLEFLLKLEPLLLSSTAAATAAATTAPTRFFRAIDSQLG